MCSKPISGGKDEGALCPSGSTGASLWARCATPGYMCARSGNLALKPRFVMHRAGNESLLPSFFHPQEVGYDSTLSPRLLRPHPGAATPAEPRTAPNSLLPLLLSLSKAWGARAPAGVPAAFPCPQNSTRALRGCAGREAQGASQLAFQVAPAPWAGGQHGALQAELARRRRHPVDAGRHVFQGSAPGWCEGKPLHPLRVRVREGPRVPSVSIPAGQPVPSLQLATSAPRLVFPAWEGGGSKVGQQNLANQGEPSPSAGECEVTLAVGGSRQGRLLEGSGILTHSIIKWQ